jgi:hypothetical protein
MKRGILLLLVVSSVTANAQKLKDLLYSGKLKNDSGTVVRKTDDLSTKIDTAKKKPAEPEKIKLTAVVKDSSARQLTAQPDSAAVVSTGVKDNNTVTKDNNKIWKVYMDSMQITFKDEVLTSKKIKSGTYYVLVDYEIGPDGHVTINNVYPSPENSYLQQQVKERLMLTAPQLNPVLNSTGQPRKVVRKYNFTLTKT